MSGGDPGESTTPGASRLEVESFRDKLTITVSWRGNAIVEEYVLMRARDETGGIGLFEEIYRGQGTRYTDKNVEDNIRYVYRVDAVQGGKVNAGEETGIGVGSNADIDIYEPNDRKEQATTLTSFRHAAMYYFLFSDGRELLDIDWYKIKIERNGVAYLKIDEEGVEGITTLRMRIEGQDAFLAEQGKWYELRNESVFEREFFIEIKADKGRYVESGFLGGMISRYKIMYSDIKEDDYDNGDDNGDDGNGDDNGDNGNGDDNGNDDDKKNTIEEMSALFEIDENGWLIFLLNEKKYQDSSYTFWKYLDREWETDEGISMELIKESGNYLGGYGYFFAGGYVEGYGNCMLVILIQTSGSYTIGKVIEGKYEELIRWRSSVYLRRGYGVRNTVGVKWDQERQEYMVTINGIEQTRFVDVQEPVCLGNQIGVVAVLTAIEQFPQTPVKIGYK